MTAADPTIEPTVVLVEDDPALGAALRFSLGLEGWRVVFCASGEALLECPLPSGPFCIVSDLHLPGMSGLQALAELRRRGVSQPAFLITGPLTAAGRRAAARLNVRLVLKPLVGDELMIAVRGALHGPA